MKLQNCRIARMFLSLVERESGWRLTNVCIETLKRDCIIFFKYHANTKIYTKNNDGQTHNTHTHTHITHTIISLDNAVFLQYLGGSVCNHALCTCVCVCARACLLASFFSHFIYKKN